MGTKKGILRKSEGRIWSFVLPSSISSSIFVPVETGGERAKIYCVLRGIKSTRLLHKLIVPATDGRSPKKMLRDGMTQTPSRFELLSMVRKHSKFLAKPSADEDDASDVEMDIHFWHDVLNVYFVSGKESRGRQEDDMLFFVRKGSDGNGSSESGEDNSPFFVRSHQVLRNYQSVQGRPLAPIYKVVKTVYASPSRINFHLDSRKAVETTAAYPDICFAVDDFDSTFDAVVLTDVDHCYCVILNANDGAAFPYENLQQDNSSRDNFSLKSGTTAVKTKSSKTTLFSGFVSYQMVRDAYDAGRTGFGSLLSLAHSPGKADRLYMKGPGGRGEVEVAVSGVVDQGKEEWDHHSSKGLSIGKIVRRAASVASVAAKHAYAAASSTRSSYEEMLPLRCCLMSISLPWEHIAHDLLFKGSPPVNL
ncbi:uncharacterized protein [Coffea arabica]|uniref:Uncharacterized protein isoform X2 n=1 Tax=Coffea arabica TaxID=13443 RepID=A0ABM4VV30_COFAR